MSEITMDDAQSTRDLVTTETNSLIKDSGINNEDEEAWLYGKQKIEENVDTTTVPTIDEVATQSMDQRETATIPIITNTPTLIGNSLDDDSDDDDGIQITIRDIKEAPSGFQTLRQNSRTISQGPPTVQPKPQITRGVDLDAPGLINGQPTYEYDIANAYKDDEKPWKKPGADITDYFNYGFTEETWVQYGDRQRRLRAENNLARLNPTHIPQMPPMLPGHPPIGHPMHPHQQILINKPQMNIPIMPRPPLNMRKPDGKIDVIGSTDLTSRRQLIESQNFEHPPFMNGPPFSVSQPPNGQPVNDLVNQSQQMNGPPSQHGTPPGGGHPIATLGAHRVPMMPPQPGMPFRPPYGHPHPPGAPAFFPHGPPGAMHGERLPQPYFIPRHPQQPWEKPNVPPVHGFPPGHFPPQPTLPPNLNSGRAPSSQSATPEDRSSRSSTPEENRTSGNGGENDKGAKDDRYRDRYRDDREHHSSSRRRSSPKDRQSSSYRSHHRTDDREYERPRSDRKSSRDRDDKYERYSRKRHHRDDNGRHHRNDDDSSHNHRSSRRSPKNFSSPPKSLTANNSQPSSTASPQASAENSEPIENDPSTNTMSSVAATASSSSPNSRSRRDESERSSRHGHHKKSSKRSRRDSGDERGHRRRSKDKSSSKKSTSQTETSSDTKEQLND